MAKAKPVTTQLQAQYAAKVVDDLERITREKHRISDEIAALQSELRDLDENRALLEGMRQALAAKPARGRKPAAPTKRKPRKTRAKAAAGRPTLVDLIRGHLATQSQPRSAAEITDALTRAHPERTIKNTVVRATMENLVARGLVSRHKQGRSVRYT